MLRSLLFILLLMAVGTLSAQLEVTNAAPITPENLISNVFLGDGVEVVSITFEGDAGSVGLFTQGLDDIGIDRGIVMTTGAAVSSPGVVGVNSPASTQSNENTTSTAFDADLNTIVDNNGINDVMIYTIEFIPVSDTLRFTYSFASEEYPQFVCSNYNDAFGFFISGPGINGPYENNAENIALIPGTDRPVTINNVNPGMVGSAGNIVNCQGDAGSLDYSEFYNSNFGTSLPVYDGYTDVFTAQAVVMPCSTYTIKLAIADVFDGIFDSGVFLEAKSFGTGSLDVEIEGLAIDGGMAEGCSEGEIVFNLPSPVEADYDVEFSVGGTATEGVDYPDLPDMIIIPEGDSTFRLPISAYEDFIVEGDETIELSVQRDPCNRDTFTIIIKDNRLVDPDLGPDLMICASEEVQLDGTVPIELPPPPRFVNDTPLPIDQTNVPFVSEIDVFGVLPVELGPEAIKQICIDSLQHQWIDDIDIFLVGPDGQFLELTTDNGAEGGNLAGPDLYYNTCFTVDAVTPINAPGPFAPPEAVPFTGNWQPEGVFSDLWDGDYRTNGTWQLIVTDDSNGFFGTLYSWSICFNPVYQVEYAWSPAAGLSCVDCPDPIASPDVTTEYILTVTDSYGCTKMDTINIEVEPALVMTELQCGAVTTSSVQVLWPALAGATGYEVNINGMGWMPASGSLEHLVTGLGLEEDVEIMVRGIGGDCPSFPATITCTTLNCTPATLEAVPVATNCANGDDGSVQINVMTGTGPFSYELGGVTNDTGLFTGLSADTYVATVTDGDGCPGTISFVVDQPPVPMITEVVENALDCNGATDGALTVNIVDGNGPYTFDWGGGITDSIATGLEAGTYTVDLIDAGNCTFSLEIELIQPELLVATTAVDSAACNGEATGQAWVTPEGGTQPYTFTWEDGQLTDTAFLLPAGNHDIAVTDALGCTLTEQVTIDEPAVLTAMLGSTDALCNGAATGSLAVTPQGGSGAYIYSWIDLADNSEIGTTPTLADQSAGTYEVVLTDGNGCIYTDQVVIGEPEALLLTDLLTTPPTCDGGTDGTANVTVIGGTEPYTVTWDTGVNGDNENSLNAGDHYVLVSDANGCTDSLSFSLEAPTAVTAEITSTLTSCFEGTDGTATVVPDGGTAPYTFLWSNGDEDATAIDLPAGLVSVEVRDANGCTTTAEITVEQPEALTVELNGDDPDCFGAVDGSITATPTGGTGPYTFAWSDTQDGPTATGLSADDYSVIVTDFNGCTVTAELTLDEPDILELSTTTEEQACSGPPNGEAQVIATGGTEPYTYLWDDGQETATAAGLTAGVYSVTVTDDQGCSLSMMAEVGLAETVEIIGFETTDADCNGAATGSITVELQGGTAPFTWSTPLMGLTAGNYELTVTDANNCTDVLEASIGEPDLLTITETVTNVVCAGETTGAVDLTVNGGTEPYTYAWSNTAVTEDITDLGSGTYTVTVTDGQGCQTIFSSEVQQASELRLTAAIENVLCNGAASGHIVLDITGGASPYTFAWSNGTTAGTLAAAVAGDYEVTVTDAFGCTLVESFNVSEPTALSGNFTTQNVSCFAGRDGLVKAEMSGGTPPYRFRMNNEAWQSSSAFLALGAGAYNLTAEDANGCQYALGNAIIGQPVEITIEFAENPIQVRFGESFTVEPIINGEFPIVSYAWEPKDTTFLSCSECLIQELVGDYQRDLFLTVTDENGCTARERLRIEVSKDFPVEVPTGFTPNGDFINDLLLVHGLPGIEVLDFRVWDRWGEQVYAAPNSFFVNDPDTGWDGTFRGQNVNGGVYLWQVEVRYEDDRTEVLKGQVTLIR